MKNNFLRIIVIISFFQTNFGSGMYLWQYTKRGESSCCLHAGGVDICNPHTPCTRYLQSDLQGISTYLYRIVGTEGGQSLLNYSTLETLYDYISSVVNGYITPQISYRFDIQRPMIFLHDKIDIEKKQKASKPTAAATAATAKGPDLGTEYLKQMGVIRPLVQCVNGKIKKR